MKINPKNTHSSLDVQRTQQNNTTANTKDKVVEQAGNVGSSANVVEISDNAKLLQKTLQTINSTPDVRADRVAEIKKKIKEGSYHVNATDIADKLVDEHLLSDFGKNNL